jgi:endonuclease-3 related protein
MPQATAESTSTFTGFYELLLARFGPQHWWPGDTATEIAVGAILTQNTNWKNVEKALENLIRADTLTFPALRNIRAGKLAQLIRPAGYYNVKARRLKNFVSWLYDTHDGELDRLRSLPLSIARAQLLSVNGIGPETADSILLYALDRPTFVIDAYTMRIFRRHRLIDNSARYDDVKGMIERLVPNDARLFNEYHALIVRLAKEHCRPSARCENCPLSGHDHDATIR